MDKLYALFVKTGYEKNVVEYLIRKLDSEKYEPFYSKREKYFHTHGDGKTKDEVLFPGYVFVESNMESVEFVIKMLPIMKECKYVHRIVNSEHGASYCNIEEEERERLLKFVGRQGFERTVCMSEGCIEGDRIVIVSGPLKGMESRIRKVNRHKRIAIVEIKMFDEVKEVKVALEVFERIN